MRVHDQLHPQVEAPAGKVHDEQRARKFHNSSGNNNTDTHWPVLQMFGIIIYNHKLQFSLERNLQS